MAEFVEPDIYNGAELSKNSSVNNQSKNLRVNPDDVRFTQDTASPNYSKGGTISETIAELKSNPTLAETIDPIRVVEKDGKLWTLDNRRLVAFQNARIKEIPVIRESLENPLIMNEFLQKFRPIEGNKKIVITPKKGRAEARKILREYGKYTNH